MRRREERRENADEGGRGGLLEVEYGRVMRIQLWHMYFGRVRVLERACGSFIFLLCGFWRLGKQCVKEGCDVSQRERRDGSASKLQAHQRHWDWYPRHLGEAAPHK